MVFSTEPIPDPMVKCPLFGKEIADGLCWDISNIGNDSLKLPANEVPPCGWAEAHKVCAKCPQYLEMGK